MNQVEVTIYMYYNQATGKTEAYTYRTELEGMLFICPSTVFVDVPAFTVSDLIEEQAKGLETKEKELLAKAAELRERAAKVRRSVK